MSNNEIANLTKQLSDLSIKHEKLLAETAAIKHELKDIKELIATDKSKGKKSGITGFLSIGKARPFKVGDKVQIRNPKAHQENIGYIKDFNKIGQARVDTPLGDLITRATGNLILLDEDSS